MRAGRTARSAAAAAPIAAAPEWSTAEPPALDPHRFTYSVVIPVFNSEPIVATTIDRTVAFFESHGFSYEVILVNDGSTDGSWDVLQRAPARDSSHTVRALFAFILVFGENVQAASCS